MYQYSALYLNKSDWRRLAVGYGLYTLVVIELSDLQKAACQIMPQGISLALTIRELVRQGCLFGALVLMRPLIERAAIISYLYRHPSEIEAWKAGWQYRDRPSLSKMLETMDDKVDIAIAKQICDHFNHIVHGDTLRPTMS